MYGWRGTVLSVDLPDLRIEREALDPGFARQFIDGRGFTSKVLFSRLRPGVDPLSAENVLCLGAGPLSGTSLAMYSRIQAVERAFNIRRGISPGKTTDCPRSRKANTLARGKPTSKSMN
jgi:aldehyde:ferredoxin oxidoreductase